MELKVSTYLFVVEQKYFVALTEKYFAQFDPCLRTYRQVGEEIVSTDPILDPDAI